MRRSYSADDTESRDDRVDTDDSILTTRYKPKFYSSTGTMHYFNNLLSPMVTIPCRTTFHKLCTSFDTSSVNSKTLTAGSFVTHSIRDCWVLDHKEEIKYSSLLRALKKTSSKFSGRAKPFTSKSPLSKSLVEFPGSDYCFFILLFFLLFFHFPAAIVLELF